MGRNRDITITSAIKSIARFWSILSIGLILLFIFGEGLKLFELTIKEWIGFILFPTGLVIGLLTSWKKEITGSLVSIICVLLFTLIMGVNWFVFGLLAPAFIFLLHGLLIRNPGRN
jgi:hypothetical protein